MVVQEEEQLKNSQIQEVIQVPFLRAHCSMTIKYNN